MSSNHEKTYERLCQYTRDTALLASAQSLLYWDERTMLPSAGGEYRAKQTAYLAGLIHERQTAAEVGQWLSELIDAPLAVDRHSDQGATIHQLKRHYEKQTKLPKALVQQLAAAEVTGQRAWVEARQNNDFAAFAPHLEWIVDLLRQKADAYGYEACRYDALLDDYELGATTSWVAAVLERLRAELVPLVAEIAASRCRPDTSILTRHFPISVQEAFGREAAAAIGFDFSAGRLDVTDHPFCCEITPGDCRITTRYEEGFFPGAFYGVLHEAGHGMYEQGLREEFFGLPPGQSVSLGIHESRSRLWENLVGRSQPFWQWLFPKAQSAFPAALAGVAVDDFYFAVNSVKPSLIRVAADEATYNLHIIIRFELEQSLLEGDLPVADLPAAWNEKYEQYLGIRPESDADGVLQDIHWSGGLIGYFPTYTLGNLYAAQLFQQAEADIGPLAQQFASGEFAALLRWLRRNVHDRGMCYSPAELAVQVTGQPLSHQPLMRYLRAKLGPLYQLS
jgi:carboxypeptidase Taq